MEGGRPLSFRAAAELTGLPIRDLRTRVRKGSLDAVVEEGRPVGVRLAALAAAGLLPDEVAVLEHEGNGKDQGSAANLPAPRGTWVPMTESQELLRRLLAEREVLGAQWKDTSEALYREIIDEQRTRIARLEEEKSELTRDLRDALRRIPKLMELEELEGQKERTLLELAEQRRRGEEGEAEVQRLREQAERLDRELAESTRRRQDLSDTVRKLRARGVWDRLLDREPRPGDEG